MAPLGRLRTQAIWVLRPKVKYCHSKTLGAVFSGLGRLGRKIPEDLVVASGQWSVASLDACRAPDF